MSFDESGKYLGVDVTGLDWTGIPTLVVNDIETQLDMGTVRAILNGQAMLDTIEGASPQDWMLTAGLMMGSTAVTVGGLVFAASKLLP